MSTETSTEEDQKHPPAAHGPGENDGADKNYDFVQISKRTMHAWGELCLQKPLAAKILFMLVERMGRSNNAVVCSYATLTEITGKSRTSVANAIKVLKQQNWIATVKVGSATAYCVNEKVAWQASRTQRRYALFSATVIASETEQDKREIESKTKLKSVPFFDKKSGERIMIGPEKMPPPDQGDLDLD